MNKVMTRLSFFFAVMTAATSLMAMKVEPIISYQAILTDSDGMPLNGTFDMTFRIMDESGAMLWEESHAGVEVNEGLFTVIIGETDPIPPDAFVSESDEGDYAIRNLEIQIGGDPPLTPTARLLTAPYSVASHRVAGDIFTSPGSIRMGVEPQPFEPAVEINAGQNNTTLMMGIEPQPFNPAPEMEMLMDENSTTFRMGVDPQPFNPSVEIQALTDRSSITMFDPSATNDDKTVSRMTADMNGLFGWNLFHPNAELRPVMDMNTGPGGEISWLMFNPQPEPPAIGVLGMNTHATGAEIALGSPQFGGLATEVSPPMIKLASLGELSTFQMFDPSAGTEGGVVSEMNANVGGQFSWLMFNPQPEPPGRPIMDMHTGPGGELSWLMFNPQPEPPAIGILGMNTYADGAEIALGSPQFSGLRAEVTPPMIQVATLGELSTIKMLDPTAGPDGGVISEMNASVGGTFSWLMFNPQPEPPGRPVMDMSTGPVGEIDWTFFYPGPLDPDEPALKIRTWADPDGVNGTAEIQMFSSPPFPSEYPVIDLYTYEGGGGISLNEPESGFMTIHTPRSISFIDGGSGGTTGIISGDGDSYLLHNLGIGTSGTGNILTIAPNTEADPIADAWTTYSSRRWKKNIKTIDNAIDKVERLRGVTFDWKADGKHDIGLIAEEVGQVFPEVVAYEKNGIDAKSVDYARLVSVLIEAVKEQQKTISGLQQEVADLSLKYRQLSDTQGEDSQDVRAVELTNINR